MKAPRASVVSLPHDGADCVERFAEKHDISRAQAFKEIAEGRLVARKVGGRTIVTHEDAAEWRRTLPKASANGVSKKPDSDTAPSRRRGRPKKQRSIEPETTLSTEQK